MYKQYIYIIYCSLNDTNGLLDGFWIQWCSHVIQIKRGLRDFLWRFEREYYWNKSIAFPLTNHSWKLQSAKRWLSLYEVKHLPRVYNKRISNFFIFIKSYGFYWRQQLHWDTFVARKSTSHSFDHGFAPIWSQNVAGRKKTSFEYNMSPISSNFTRKCSLKFGQASQPSEEKQSYANTSIPLMLSLQNLPTRACRWFQGWVFDKYLKET